MHHVSAIKMTQEYTELKWRYTSEILIQHSWDDCHNKYRLLPCSPITGWSFPWGGTVFYVRYKIKGNYSENNSFLWAGIVCRLHEYIAHTTLLNRGGNFNYFVKHTVTLL